MDIFSQYKVWIISGIIVALMVVLLGVWLLFGPSNDAQTPPPSESQFLSDYSFLESERSDEEKRLMLLGVIYAEAYLTFEDGDFSGLVDLETQATPNFKSDVERKITEYQQTETENIIAVIDTGSVNLNRVSDAEARLTMSGKVSMSLQSDRSVTVMVQLVKSGEFWLINNIRVQ